jgi:glycosyltransferase involved in cell wall biosynthesis
MRIGVIHNLPRGGAHRRLEQQLLHVHGEVIEICLGCSCPITAQAIRIPLDPIAPRAPRLVRPPLRYLDLARVVVAWARAAAALRRVRPDVVFANGCGLLQAPGALIAAPAASLYFCDEPRRPASDPDLRASQSDSTRLIYAPLYELERRLDRAATLRATRIATNSRHTAGRIEAIYGRAAEVLPMGVPEGFTPSFETPTHILSVGSLVADKGHELVLEAVARARARWPVVVVAPRPDGAAAARLSERARAVGIALDVRTAIGDDELVAAYRRAFATLYLAREEPFGLASLEAQACGSPVIVTASGGLPETLIDGVSGWVVPRSAEAAAARIDALGDVATRERMAHAAAEHGAVASWSRAGQALERMLVELYEASALGRIK